MLTDAKICAEVATTDLARARSFFEETLGPKPARAPDERGVYYRAGGRTMLNLYEREHWPSDQTAATFLIDDMDGIMRKLPLWSHSL